MRSDPMKRLCLIAVLILVGCEKQEATWRVCSTPGGLTWPSSQDGRCVSSDAPEKPYGMIHKPATGCPKGYQLKEDMFSMQGKRSDGCVNPDHPGALDFILPGESVGITIQMSPIEVMQDKPTGPII